MEKINENDVPVYENGRAQSVEEATVQLNSQIKLRNKADNVKMLRKTFGVLAFAGVEVGAVVISNLLGIDLISMASIRVIGTIANLALVGTYGATMSKFLLNKVIYNKIKSKVKNGEIQDVIEFNESSKEFTKVDAESIKR